MGTTRRCSRLPMSRGSEAPHDSPASVRRSTCGIGVRLQARFNYRVCTLDGNVSLLPIHAIYFDALMMDNRRCPPFLTYFLGLNDRFFQSVKRRQIVPLRAETAEPQNSVHYRLNSTTAPRASRLPTTIVVVVRSIPLESSWAMSIGTDTSGIGLSDQPCT